MKNTRVTKATLKAFIKKNQGNLFVRVNTQFDGMTDGIERGERKWFKPEKQTYDPLDKSSFGIRGVWCVGGSRDYFSRLNVDGFEGISCCNCCGSWDIAIPILKFSVERVISECLFEGLLEIKHNA